MLRSGRKPAERRRMDRDRLLRDLRWLAEGNPRYMGTQEGKQNPELAKLMAEDLLLSYTHRSRCVLRDQRTILKLKMGFWSTPNNRTQMGSIISVPRAAVMSPKSMISVQPKLRSSSLTMDLASASSPLTNTV